MRKRLTQLGVQCVECGATGAQVRLVQLVQRRCECRQLFMQIIGLGIDVQQAGDDFAAPIADKPATPAPITRTLAGSMRPAAVICPVKKRGKLFAASMIAR